MKISYGSCKETKACSIVLDSQQEFAFGAHKNHGLMRKCSRPAYFKSEILIILGTLSKSQEQCFKFLCVDHFHFGFCSRYLKYYKKHIITQLLNKSVHLS